MALNMRSNFLGKSLSTGVTSPKPATSKLQTQALLKSAKKDAKKVARTGTQKTGGLGKQVQKQAKKAPQQAKKEVKKATRGLPNPLAGTQKTKPKAKLPTPKLPSPPKQAPKKVSKAANKVAKRAPARAKQAFAGGTKGWFGGAGGPQDLDKWYGPDRALFLPGGLYDRSEVPVYLNGTLAGDYGYDPLGLGKDGGKVEEYRAYELLHARWAMLAAAGIILPEGLQANGADIKGGTWFETGALMLDGGTLNYFAVPWAVIGNPLPLFAVAAIEVVLMGAVEKFRKEGTGPPGYSPGVGKFDENIFNGLDNLYPGGPFDPLGLADDPENFAELKVKEIKNGRLAMVSVLGFAVQSLVTGEGPYANWSKHVSDPFGYNLLTIIGNEDRVPTL